MHKITHNHDNTLKNMGSTLILQNLVGVHPTNIHKIFLSKLMKTGLRKEVEKVKQFNNNNADWHSVITSVTFTHCNTIQKQVVSEGFPDCY